MTDSDIVAIGANAAAALKGYVERLERLEEERKDIAEGVKNVMHQAKGEGFDPKIIRKILQLRKMDPAEREELEQLMDTYRAAIGM